LVLEKKEALRGGSGRYGLDLVRAQESLHRVTLNRIIFDDKDTAHSLRELRLELLENLS
jgi:dephospho-CoA kinase